ncbi:hypothetical protein Aaci_0493 [Alicyclobacillus acidocaldarius subsp. acidocaldarius DSM 446]|uniref:Uncharacterized protein n=1 Tax=Alicyclobacillus acidocaldarius subsp. acidocaldarius (strain ATCC 27009 / DSM 446 / BCRC 14685 / JCM 5260 / KCTC 1825 / NBRC 15652 / NCIMB 11725 / NRRL B-14509 / 104-IA) TaxID=521098 RepID=C8WSP5_ALIAD|nr:hypothetical protein Aaci_0493 [Alicyclobacillus acidocaldarius subsp. acidocaldarius DSM 446]
MTNLNEQRQATVVEARPLKWRRGLPTVLEVVMEVNGQVRIQEYILRPENGFRHKRKVKFKRASTSSSHNGET